jgi:ribosomal protein S18 acetylase RimI-like enzyme
MKNFANLSGYTLRALNPADTASFIELGLPTCAFMHGRPQTPPEKMRQHFISFVREYAYDENSEIHVVESDAHEIVAQLWLHLTRNRFNGLNELWIWDITVREDHQKRGIGTHLMEFARKRAEMQNCAELWLLVSSKNDKAVRIYESVGLRSAGYLMKVDILPTETNHDLNRHRFNTAIIRPLKPHDLDQLYKLWQDSGLPCRPRGRDSRDRLTRHLGGTKIGGWGVFESNLLVAGCLTAHDGRKGYIERLATLPDYRHRGFAGQVVIASRQSLLESGALVIAALIEQDNTASRKLFEANGFIHSSTLCYYSFRETSDA